MSKKKSSRNLRDTRIRAMSAGGMSNMNIAAEMGLERRQVGDILNSDDTKRIVEAAESDLKLLVIEAIQTLQDAMANRMEFQGMGNAVKAAIAVLKNQGLLKESVDLNHKFPKPTVIRRASGEEVVLGAEDEK